ncbi:hypothetical protein EON82_11795 [bacterium]|nr:MAG: hypothetical protein EON82_11795 [bacterium]
MNSDDACQSGHVAVAHDPDGAHMRRLMEAATPGEALAAMEAATLGGYDAATLVDLLDYARVVPSPMLDRLRSEFVVDREDPYRR